MLFPYSIVRNSTGRTFGLGEDVPCHVRTGHRHYSFQPENAQQNEHFQHGRRHHHHYTRVSREERPNRIEARFLVLLSRLLDTMVEFLSIGSIAEVCFLALHSCFPPTYLSLCFFTKYFQTAAPPNQPYLGVAEAVHPVRGPVPLPEEAAGLLLRPDPALVVRLDGLERLLHGLLETVVPQLVDVLLQEVVDLLPRKIRVFNWKRGGGRVR